MKRNMLLILALLALGTAVVGLVHADIPGRITPAGPAGTGTSGANPGTQQQELPNITFPAPYNVFEFVVTCMACHGGTVDQTAGHGSNWGGTNMASAMRDPIFRANQVLVNNTVKNLLGADGTGNVCMRCHSPNGWLSGRFDPILGGKADGRDTMESIVLSTETRAFRVGIVPSRHRLRHDQPPDNAVGNRDDHRPCVQHAGRCLRLASPRQALP